MTSLWARLAGFAGLPLLSLVTPLLALPVLGRVAGASGWASLVAGEAVGTIAGTLLAYGWHTSGPARIAALADPMERAHAYRDSLLVRGTLTVLVTPVLVVVCLAVAAPGFELATVLMGCAGAVPGLSFAWYAVGAGDPRAIAVYEVAPRVAAAAVAAGLMAVTREPAVYPALAVLASLGGLALFSRRVLRGAPRARRRATDLRRLLVRDRGLAVVDIVAGAYGSLPAPVVSSTAPAVAASSYASGDKLYRFASYVPLALANAFQSWTVEGPAVGRTRRLRAAVAAHAGVGLVGWAGLAVLGPWASGVLFGEAVATTAAVCLWLGLAFAVASVRVGLVRLVLVPAAQVRVVVVSTVAGACAGLALVVGLGVALGPAGAAIGLAAGEAVAVAVLAVPALGHLASPRSGFVRDGDGVARSGS